MSSPLQHPRRLLGPRPGWWDGFRLTWGAASGFLIVAMGGCGPAPCPAGSTRFESDGLCHLTEDEGEPADGGDGGDGGDAGDGGGTDSASEGGAWIDPGSPVWTAEEAGAALEAALEGGIPNAIPIRDAYEELMTWSDSSCPLKDDEDDIGAQGEWQGDCTSIAGVRYHGLSQYFEEHTDMSWVIHALTNYTITEVDGRELMGAGTLELDGSVDETGTYQWTSATGGVFHRDDDPTWLGAEAEVGLFVIASDGEDTSRFQLDGGIGNPAADIMFTGLVTDTTVCSGDPMGLIGVRDPGGHWFSVTLSECGGCGPFTWHGQDQGELCPGPALLDALATLVAAQGRP
jgi:hypothetical protein